MKRSGGSPRLVDERFELPRDEGRHLLDAAVEIDRGNQRFITVGEQRLLAASTGFLLAAPEEQVLAKVESLGEPGERRRGNQRRFHFRFPAFVARGETAKQQIGDRKAQDRVAEQLER